MDEFILRSARHIAAEACGRVLKQGDAAVDATMGNGHDTLLLCRLVGDTGKVSPMTCSGRRWRIPWRCCGSMAWRTGLRFI